MRLVFPRVLCVTKVQLCLFEQESRSPVEADSSALFEGLLDRPFTAADIDAFDSQRASACLLAQASAWPAR